MERPNNYQIQAAQAKERFLTYDQEEIIRRLHLEADEQYLYIPMLSRRHRICRNTGHMEKLTETGWTAANSHGEVMTLLDLLCDSSPDRFLAGRWKAMGSFGLMFHQNLLEGQRDPWADRFEADPDGFRRACLALQGRPFPQGDIAYAVELFDGLPVLLQLWFGDEEFPANLRFLWDENALMYLKYETMWFAKGLILERIREKMGQKSTS